MRGSVPELMRVVAGLDRQARALDRSASRRPLATMMWGVASALDGYLDSPASLASGYPPEVTHHLALSVLLITGARHQDDYEAIAAEVAATPEEEQRKALERRRRA